jgi:hypothetical protein
MQRRSSPASRRRAPSGLHDQSVQRASANFRRSAKRDEGANRNDGDAAFNLRRSRYQRRFAKLVKCSVIVSEHARTARGRCGSPLLHRSGLPPPAPCRSPGALTVFLSSAEDVGPSTAPSRAHKPLRGCPEERPSFHEACRISVRPMGDSQEMIAMRAEKTEMVLPCGASPEPAGMSSRHPECRCRHHPWR